MTSKALSKLVRQMTLQDQLAYDAARSGRSNNALAANAYTGVPAVGKFNAMTNGVYTVQVPPFNPNEHAAYQMSLRDLVTMWQAKNGDTWVDVASTREDNFWQQAVDRMGAAHLFEASGGYYRLKDL